MLSDTETVILQKKLPSHGANVPRYTQLPIYANQPQSTNETINIEMVNWLQQMIRQTKNHA